MAETDDVLVRYAFHCAQLADDTFVVDALHAVEEISRLFTLTVDLRTLDPDLSFGDIVGHPASLEMRQLDQPVFLSGLVTHLEQTSAEDGQYLYRASVRPRLWRLTLSAHTRVFQHLTARSIVQQVLEENGVPASDIRFEVAGTLPEREFCVQYQETDLQFVSRLLEYEGLCYFFEHEADKEILVITDDPQAHPAIVGDGLAYHPRTGQVPDQETIFELVYQERLVTERVLLADYNAETPDVQVSALSSPVPDQTGLRYEYGPHVKDNDQAGRLAEIRKEEIACQRVVLDGRSDATVLRVGHTFDLGDYFRSDLNQRYLITRVEHRRVRADEASLHLTVASDDTPERMAYENRFTCIPWSVPYRPPRRTPVPRVPGLLTAKLETAGGPYAYLDDQGRYRFRALFDQSSTGAATASLAARKAEPHAGTNYGIHFPDHAGNEVVLAFENGDPDRPVIMATMANPSNPSPAVNENRSQNVIRTWSQHELTFDDLQGEENIYLHSTKNWTIDITHDKNQVVGHNETLEVAVNRDKVVGANQSEQIGQNKSIMVGANHDESIGANMTQNVGLAKMESITMAKTLTIGAAYQVTVGAAMSVAVAAFRSESVGLHSNETVGRDKTLSIGKNYTLSVGDTQTLTVVKDVKERVGGDHHEEVAKEWAVNAKKIQLVAKDQLVLKVGKAEITLKKNGDITIKGKKINVKGSGDVVIKGSKIKEN